LVTPAAVVDNWMGESASRTTDKVPVSFINPTARFAIGSDLA
jgi:hypothetical protein